MTFAGSANAKGKIGFDDNPEMTFGQAAGITFCMLPDRCICPAGKVLPDHIVLATFPGESALVAVTGGLPGASARMVCSRCPMVWLSNITNGDMPLKL